MDKHEGARRLNTEVGLLGLRAQATAVGLVQLCGELLRAGVLNDDAITRIKTAIADQIVVSYKPHRDREAFETSLHRRLDKLFPVSGQGNEPLAKIGDAEEMRDGLGLDKAD